MMHDLFDAADRISAFVHREDRRRKKLAQIQDSKDRKCGNCEKWMTSNCVPEKLFGQFKSAGSIACSEFEQSDRAKALVRRFEEELAEILSPAATNPHPSRVTEQK